jgi:HAMP domain-containing protein
MALKIMHKLSLLGIIALIGLSFLAFMSYRTNSNLEVNTKKLTLVQDDNEHVARLRSKVQDVMTFMFWALLERHQGVLASQAKEELDIAFNYLNNKTADWQAKNIPYIDKEALELFDKSIKNLEHLYKNDLMYSIENHDKVQDTQSLEERIDELTKQAKKEQIKLKNSINIELQTLAGQQQELISSANRHLWIVYGSAILVIIPFLIVLIRSITRPLNGLCQTIAELSLGNYLIEIKDQDRGDEIGTLARAAVHLRHSVEKSMTLQRMVDHLRLPILLANRQGVITYANQASFQSLQRIERFLSLNKDQLIGSELSRFYYNENQELQQGKFPHEKHIKIES